MTATETPSTHDSAVHALIESTDEPLLDSENQCDGRAEEPAPPTPPPSNPQRMENGVNADADPKNGVEPVSAEGLPSEATGEKPTNGSPPEPDEAERTAS